MTMPTPPYDAVKDFTPIALVAKAPLAIAIKQDLPFNDVKGLIAYAKANPGNVTFAIGSSASAGHLSTELLKRAAGIDYLVVPYKGSGPAYQDLIGGRIDAFIDPDPRLGVAREGGQAQGHRRHVEGTAAGVCRTCPPSAKPFPASSSTAGTACGARRRCRRTSPTGSTPK